MSNQATHPASNVPPNIPPFLQIDLIKFTSDGTNYFPPTSTLLPDASCLPVLSDVFNMQGFSTDVYDDNITFVTNLPAGYTASRFVSSLGHSYIKVWGHPSGECFDSLRVFCQHVASIVTNSLAVCPCELCVACSPGAKSSKGGGSGDGGKVKEEMESVVKEEKE